MDEIVIIIIGLLGAIIGYFIKYFLDKKHMLFNSSSNIKRENYKKFVSIIIDIFKAVKDKKKNKTVDVISEIYDFYKDYLLFAGPSVIRSFGECMQLLYRYNKIENKEDNKEIF